MLVVLTIRVFQGAATKCGLHYRDLEKVTDVL